MTGMDRTRTDHRQARAHATLLDGLDAPAMDFTIGPGRSRPRTTRPGRGRTLRRLLP